MEKIGNLEKEILDTLQYFLLFDYPPTLEEIHTFLKKKTSKRALVSILEKMVEKSLVKSWKIGKRSGSWLGSKKKEVENGYFPNFSFLSPFTKQVSIPNSQLPASNSGQTRYTLGEYKDTNATMRQWNNRHKLSLQKIQKVGSYIKFLSLFPQIKLIGLSGSVAMLNAGEDHDVDLFIITARNRLWTGRFIAILLAQILGIRRKRLHTNQKNSDKSAHISLIRNQKNSDKSDLSDIPGFLMKADASLSFPNSSENVSDKVCLNLFFDESSLAVPKFKRTEYVAHEVLQMKPLVEKDGIYLRFIDANRWVFDIFPNAPPVIPRSEATRNLAKPDTVQYLAKRIYAPFRRWISHFVRNDRVNQWLEFLLKKFQLHFIKKHQTTEIVTASQLWFHPEDFEEKINS